MKVILLLITLLYMTSVSAREFTPLNTSDLSLSKASSELVNVEKSVAVVRVTLIGCMDRFGGHVSRFEVINGRGVLYFSALNINNAASENVRCIRPPEEIIKINVPFEGDIELVNLDYAGTVKL